MEIVKLTLAIAPAAIIVTLILTLNIYREERKKIRVKIIGAGLLTLVLSAVVNSLIYNYTSLDIYSPHMLNRLGANFFGLAIHEEFFKVIFIFLFFFSSDEDYKGHEIILYPLSACAVFSAGEGLSSIYFDVFSLILRLVTFVPFHILNGLLTVRFLKSVTGKGAGNPVPRILLAWLMPASVHALFKTAMSLLTGYMLFVPGLLITGGFIYYIIKIKREYFSGELSPAYKI